MLPRKYLLFVFRIIRSTNTLYGKNAEILIDKGTGIYSRCCAVGVNTGERKPAMVIVVILVLRCVLEFHIQEGRYDVMTSISFTLH